MKVSVWIEATTYCKASALPASPLPATWTEMIALPERREAVTPSHVILRCIATKIPNRLTSSGLIVSGVHQSGRTLSLADPQLA